MKFILFRSVIKLAVNDKKRRLAYITPFGAVLECLKLFPVDTITDYKYFITLTLIFK